MKRIGHFMHHGAALQLGRTIQPFLGQLLQPRRRPEQIQPVEPLFQLRIALLMRLDRFGRNLKGNIEAGLKLTSLDLGAAEQKRQETFQRFRALFERYDILLTPAGPVKPFPVEMNYPDQINGRALTNYTDWFAGAYLITLVSLPAGSAPAGLTEDGLPVGMQIVAPRFEEPVILRVARALQEASGVGWPPEATLPNDAR